jgi:16S rRNA C967 or C1407 C5-methylase (RsmB/RsmF family)
VAKDFATEHPEFEQSLLPAPLNSNGALKLETEIGAIRTWPHLHDVDGFFMIAFQRRV